MMGDRAAVELRRGRWEIYEIVIMIKKRGVPLEGDEDGTGL